jgi:rhodanese-related sulfurtransferase
VIITVIVQIKTKTFHFNSEEEAAATAAKEAACIAAEKEAKEEAERQREASKLIAKREREEYESGLAHAALVAQIASEEKEQARIAKIEADKAEKYEQSLSKDVPVVVRNHGNGRIVSYDKDSDCYRVQFDDGLQINVDGDDVDLDDDRILSPRTIVDTPFGVGEVVGLDPHVGCYAINTEINAPEGEQFLAFVQILDVAVHVEEEEEKAIVEDEAMPSKSILLILKYYYVVNT